MASMRDIQRRKASVESTGQITKAMKLVSTVKLQKARDRAESAKPYFEGMFDTVASMLARSGNISHKYLKNHPNKKKAVIVITSNRGLAGGYNSNIVKLITSKLFELIGKSGMDNKDVWKRANLDRKHFSKIQCDEKYHPKKKTVMALCIALELDLEQAKDLLARADWAFSPSSKMDLIVQKAIIDKQYDIYQLNLVLFQYTNEILGV